jgi:phosphatidate phosphatase APP1
VYEAKLVLRNFFGSPVSGAPVNVTLANLTSIQKVTDSDGSVDFGLIPQGTFSAIIEYESSTLNVKGDAATSAVTSATAPLTLFDALPIVVTVVAVIAVACATILVLKKRRRKSTENTKLPPNPAQD